VEVALGDALLLCLFALLAGARRRRRRRRAGAAPAPARRACRRPGRRAARHQQAALGRGHGASAAVTYNRASRSTGARGPPWRRRRSPARARAPCWRPTVDGDVLEPVVLVALVAVLAYTVRTPSLGEVERLA
jgi:hypothetical protein